MLFHLLDGDADSVPSVALGDEFDPADTIAPAPEQLCLQSLIFNRTIPNTSPTILLQIPRRRVGF